MRLGKRGEHGEYFFMILTQNDLKRRIATDPIPNAIIPIWAIVAYLIIAFLPARQ
jgi:hypothetical protein